MDLMGFLERLFQEEEWRKKQLQKLPPATMSDSRGLTLEDRFRMLEQPMQKHREQDLRMQDLYRNIEREGKFWGWPQPMPRNMWDVILQEQLRSGKKDIGMI